MTTTEYSRPYDGPTDNDLTRALTEQEWHVLRREGHLREPSPSYPQRTYLMTYGGGPTLVVERGEVVMQLDLQPLLPLSGDGAIAALLIQRALIRHEEALVLRLARPWPVALAPGGKAYPLSHGAIRRLLRPGD